MPLKDHIKNEIERASRDLGIPLRGYSLEESLEARSRLAQRYSKEPDKPEWLSDQTLKDYASYYSSDSWTVVQKLLTCSPILFFIDPDEDLTVWELESGSHLDALLGETFNFVFYAACADFSGMVAVEHHDVLLAMGTCRTALEAFRASSQSR